MDSPKVVFDKEEEGLDDQQMPFITISGTVKEEKFKDPEWNKKYVPTVLEMSTMRPHTRPSNKLRFKFKLMEHPKLKDMVINIDEEPLEKKEGKRSANSKRTSTKPKL